MKAYSAAIAAALLISLPALADDDARTRQSTTIHKDDAGVMHRSEQGEFNANNPSSPNRALGRERAEERHEMQEQRELRGKGATRGEEEHRTIRREHEGMMDKDRDDTVKRRMDMERHESSSERSER